MELIVKHFSQLTRDELFELYKLRVAVFIVEQQCAYPEVDDADKNAYHLWLRSEEGIQAYLRLLPPPHHLRHRLHRTGHRGEAPPGPGRPHRGRGHPRRPGEVRGAGHHHRGPDLCPGALRKGWLRPVLGGIPGGRHPPYPDGVAQTIGVFNRAAALSLSIKPRRVRARRREENEIRFLRRPVRRGKHFSAEQRASWPPQADSECAHEAAAFPVGKGKAFFDGLRAAAAAAALPLAFF